MKHKWKTESSEQLFGITKEIQNCHYETQVRDRIVFTDPQREPDLLLLCYQRELKLLYGLPKRTRTAFRIIKENLNCFFWVTKENQNCFFGLAKKTTDLKKPELLFWITKNNQYCIYETKREPRTTFMKHKNCCYLTL